jgi:DNA replication and repair protein RecF
LTIKAQLLTFPSDDGGLPAHGARHSIVGEEASADQAMRISRLTLSDFRGYGFQRLETRGRAVVLTGPNGAGKTNLLEALSFLVPGRGLRRARVQEISRRETGKTEDSLRLWGVAAIAQTPKGETELGTGRDQNAVGANRERRVVKIDGELVKGQSALAEHLSMVWLTPQMDRLFIEGASARRRFLDRLVYGFDPAHAGRVTAWDKAARSRLKLLKERRNDDGWLTALETTMAEKGVAIAAARADMALRLAAACLEADGPFPRADVVLTGQVESWLEKMPALEVEDRLRKHLTDARRRDGETGSTSEGPNRSDLAVTHLAKGVSAELCSTGEQKALLISLVLADARLRRAERGAAPILLLDEIAAHLDGERREALFGEIFALGAQAWITGTDEGVFAALKGPTDFFRVEDGVIKDQD